VLIESDRWKNREIAALLQGKAKNKYLVFLRDATVEEEIRWNSQGIGKLAFWLFLYS